MKYFFKCESAQQKIDINNIAKHLGYNCPLTHKNIKKYFPDFCYIFFDDKSYAVDGRREFDKNATDCDLRRFITELGLHAPDNRRLLVAGKYSKHELEKIIAEWK